MRTNLSQLYLLNQPDEAPPDPPDPDAQDFILAAGITDDTQKMAADRFVADVKGVVNGSYTTINIWDKFKAIYLFLGGTASAHKYNLKDPRDLDAAFRLTFFNNPTQDANGIDFNGSNQYCNTHIIPSDSLTLNSTHMTYYSKDNVTGSTQIEIGADAGGGYFVQFYVYWSGLGIGSALYSSPSQMFSTAPGSSLGFAGASRIASNDHRLFRNGVQVGSTNAGDPGYLPTTYELFLGAYNNVGSPAYHTTKRCAFASIGDGLTVAEILAFYNAVQFYQTTLGRAV